MATIKGNRSSRYTPGNPPNGDPFLRDELERIASAMQSPVQMLALDILHVAPDRLPTDRVPIVFADGTDWDPGSGAGVYAYYSGAWNKLG